MPDKTKPKRKIGHGPVFELHVRASGDDKTFAWTYENGPQALGDFFQAISGSTADIRLIDRRSGLQLRYDRETPTGSMLSIQLAPLPPRLDAPATPIPDEIREAFDWVRGDTGGKVCLMQSFVMGDPTATICQAHRQEDGGMVLYPQFVYLTGKLLDVVTDANGVTARSLLPTNRKIQRDGQENQTDQSPEEGETRSL